MRVLIQGECLAAKALRGYLSRHDFHPGACSPGASASPFRFMSGSTVAYLQSTSGTGTVKVRYVR